jgi:hypothetical protein
MKNRKPLYFYVLCIVFLCAARLSSAASNETTEEKEYYAVFMEGKKVGYSIESRVVVGDKVTTSVDFKLTISRMGVSISAETRASTVETTDGKPLGFELEQLFGMIATKKNGSINDKGKLTVIDGRRKKEYDWPSGAVMSEGMRLLRLKNGLTEGTTYSAKFFDPSMVQVFDVKVKIGSKQNIDLLGRVVPLTEVQSSVSSAKTGSIESTEYIDDDFRLQKSITPLLGMVVEHVACTKEFALSQNDVLDMIDKMFMTSPEPLTNLDEIESITYYLTPRNNDANLVLPTDVNQHVRYLGNGGMIVKVQPVAPRSGVTFPYEGSEAVIIEATKPTRYLQSEHKTVVDLARRAIGDTKDVAEAARRIEGFVSEYVENRNFSVGYASAAEVATSRQGDCTEFAVLTAAMCRAVGIPARVVVGVAYVEEFAGRQGFGGHAWAQAYVGDQWIGLDAAFRGSDRDGYDAGHIALATGNGNPEDFFNLATTLGQFKVEKVYIRTKKDVVAQSN